MVICESFPLLSPPTLLLRLPFSLLQLDTETRFVFFTPLVLSSSYTSAALRPHPPSVSTLQQRCLASQQKRRVNLSPASILNNRVSVSEPLISTLQSSSRITPESNRWLRSTNEPPRATDGCGLAVPSKTMGPGGSHLRFGSG